MKRFSFDLPDLVLDLDLDLVLVHRFPVQGFRLEQLPSLLVLDFLLDLARHRVGQGSHLDSMVVMGKKEKGRKVS